MVEWVKVMTDGAVGGGAGVVDQLVENWDKNREVEAGAPLGVMARFGTYYNYGVPLLAVLGTAFGFLRDEWATRMVTAGAQLAGRKLTQQVTKPEAAAAWTPWARDRTLEVQRRAEVARLNAKKRNPSSQLAGDYSDVNIPIMEDEAIIV